MRSAPRVRGAILVRSAAATPGTQNMPRASSKTGIASRLESGTFRSMNRSLSFFPPFMPNGTKRSPGLLPLTRTGKAIPVKQASPALPLGSMRFAFTRSTVAESFHQGSG